MSTSQTQRIFGLRSGRHGISATHSNPRADKMRAANQKLMAFSASPMRHEFRHAFDRQGVQKVQQSDTEEYDCEQDQVARTLFVVGVPADRKDQHRYGDGNGLEKGVQWYVTGQAFEFATGGLQPNKYQDERQRSQHPAARAQGSLINWQDFQHMGNRCRSALRAAV